MACSGEPDQRRGRPHDGPGTGDTARRGYGEAAMNTISLFGSAATPAAWIEIFLGLSALTMASRLPEWQWQGRVSRTASNWLPVGGLLGLAAASMIAGVMEPRVLLAALSS